VRIKKYDRLHFFYAKCRKFGKISVLKKSKIYASAEPLAALSITEEAAAEYQTLRSILGGAKSHLRVITSENDLIYLSREGIKKSTLKSLVGYLGITMEKMSTLLHMSHRNLQRKDEEELLDTLKSEKVLELAAFVQRGIDVIGNEEAFKQWLHSPVLALGNKKPIDYLDTSFGMQMALKVLGRLEQGVYS
jgi:putative toxin-antitoxin system antitoxin component (TIGR02293 family)